MTAARPLEAVPDDRQHSESSTALQAAWAVMCVAAALCQDHLAALVRAALGPVLLPGHAGVIAATSGDMLDAGQTIRRRYSAYSHKRPYFRPAEVHEAPRFRGEVMHTLKITPVGAEAIARLINRERAA